MGRLEVITGPMFSGKTEELLRRLRRWQIAGKNVAVFKPSMDTRHEPNIVRSHGGSSMACFPFEKMSHLLSDAVLYFDVIGIEEAQFLKDDFITGIEYLSDHKIVIVTGLDTNFRIEPFGIMPHLMAIAEKLDKLTAICNVCGEEATRTQRLIDGKPASLKGPEILVGGTESYEARCRDCFGRN